MSQAGINPGVYSIVSPELSPATTNPLVVTFVPGQNHSIISGPNGSGNQRWLVTGQVGQLQQIISVVETVHPTQLLYITPTNGGHNIQNEGKTLVWGINKAVEGEEVIFQEKTGSDLQVWRFIPDD